MIIKVKQLDLYQLINFYDGFVMTHLYVKRAYVSYNLAPHPHQLLSRLFGRERTNVVILNQ